MPFVAGVASVFQRVGAGQNFSDGRDVVLRVHNRFISFRFSVDICTVKL